MSGVRQCPEGESPRVRLLGGVCSVPPLVHFYMQMTVCKKQKKLRMARGRIPSHSEAGESRTLEKPSWARFNES